MLKKILEKFMENPSIYNKRYYEIYYNRRRKKIY